MRIIMTAAAVLALLRTTIAGPIAFPGAMGFGANATGGRGGDVVHVTTLDDSGPGSLRDAVSQSKRTVVFDVGGVIHVKSQIALASDLTVAGQTAPGGVAVFGAGISLSKQNNIIVRYLTVRSGIASGRGSKSFNVGEASNVIADHLSIGWGRWDNCGITKSDTVTMQNCLIHEAIKDQKFGMLLDGSRKITIARNLWINNLARNPKGKGDLQYINNVVYNWGNQGYGGGHSGAPWNQDLIGNYFIAGPDTSGGFFTFTNNNDLVHSSGNFADTDKDGTLNGRPWTENDITHPDPKSGEGATPATKPFNTPDVATVVLSAEEAVKIVLAEAGNSLHRDGVDQRQIDQLRSFGKLGKNPDDENEVGGMPPATARPAAPADTDGDGMPDAYETANGLNPNDPADAKALTADGYTRLEAYLNSLADSRR